MTVSAPPPTDVRILFIAARSAALELHNWVIRRNCLVASQLDTAMATLLPQLDRVARFDLYFGYDVSAAPMALRDPIVAYIKALRCGRRVSPHGELPRSLIRAHRAILRAVDGPQRGRRRVQR